ncbi:MAG TPA: NAD-dependent epimerase/dehydratase family protein [Solirubrobacteraceae bacterium]|nr:NAD-dependent epimerase/dehydratase family protein [Solirubrobacteraceae bacterium]
MLLLTGATGLVGSALLSRLLAEDAQIRCLARDPRRLGAQRVRVQIALGDLTDPPSFRNALRGVHTVVHLAASIRDQPRGSIEELNGIATWRMVEAAERQGVERFVFFSALGASTHHRARLLRAKALAEQAVHEARMRSIVFAPSIVYAPGDPWLALLERMALLPVMPVSGRGRALFQPIWADDVAACVIAALRAADTEPARPGANEAPARPAPATAGAAHARYELAGPETLSHTEIVRTLLRSLRRSRPLVHVPTPFVSRTLRALERLAGPNALATWDEAELMETSMTSARGAADAEALGVRPQRLAAVLGNA